MVSMSKRDRSILGGIVLAMIVGVGGSLALAASCLGRDSSQRAEDTSGFPEDRSARTSSGGVPGEEAVGEATITSVEVPAGAPTAPPAPENAPPPNPNPTPAPAVTPRALPAPQAHATVNVTVDGQRTTTTTSADGGAADNAAQGDAGAAASPTDSSTGTPATTATGASTDAGPTRFPPPIVLPPRTFTTDSPPFGASSFESNPDAGAGRFTTERNIPNVPGP
jgi:hypothetical protein